MADLSWHQNRIREGTRGGREDFKWSEVKDMSFNDRQCYLGASTKIGEMGKFGKFTTTDWYNQQRDKTVEIDEEREAVQQFEEELMQEALGLRPKKHMLAKQQMTPKEMKEYFKEQKNQLKEERVKEENVEEQQQGLGFAPHRTGELEQKKAEVLGKGGQLEGSNYDLEGSSRNLANAATSSGSIPGWEVKPEPKEDSSSSSSSSSSGDKKPPRRGEERDELMGDTPANTEASETNKERGSIQHGNTNKEDKKKERKRERKEKERKKKEKKREKKRKKKEKKKEKKVKKKNEKDREQRRR